jgi:hypothetical protein
MRLNNLKIDISLNWGENIFQYLIITTPVILILSLILRLVMDLL